MSTLRWITLAFAFFLSTGCVQSTPDVDSSNSKTDGASHGHTHETGEHDEDAGHTEHFIPAHFPKDYSAAVARLTALVTSLQSNSAPSTQALSPERELSDLVRWLPSLAADSDLGESDWNVVYSASKSFDAKQAASGSADSLAKDALVLLQGSLPELQRVAAVFDQMQVTDEAESESVGDNEQRNLSPSPSAAEDANHLETAVNKDSTQVQPDQKEKN